MNYQNLLYAVDDRVATNPGELVRPPGLLAGNGMRADYAAWDVGDELKRKRHGAGIAIDRAS